MQNGRITAPPPLGPVGGHASTQTIHASAGALWRRRRAQLPPAVSPCAESPILTRSKHTWQLTWPLAHLSVSKGRVARVDLTVSSILI
jgi:hypothetical protein